MFKKIKDLSIIFLVILMVSIISIGCQNDNTDTDDDVNEETENEDNLDEDLIDEPEDDPNQDMDNGTTEDEGMTNENGNMDVGNEALANSIVEMNGINDATVLTMDEVALVGIDSNGEDEVSDEMKKDIETKIKEENSNINEVYISNEKDMFNKINKISNDVRGGYPIDDFTDDIREMIDNITPNTK